jgi:tRNA (adenine22-N1)-methyltransferase
MKLSSRLQAIANLVPIGSYIADVGSDHGELPLALLEEEKIVGALAIENKPGPYKRLSLAVHSSDYGEKVSLSLSDGISKLNDEVNVVVLAGMGGLLIKKILLAHFENLQKVGTIIIDPHKEKEDALVALASLHYRVKEAIFLFDKGEPYFIFKTVKTQEDVTYSKEELYFGPTLKERGETIWKDYFLSEKERMKQLLLLPLNEKRRRDYQAKISYIEETIK